jgi:hypothetical protein
VEVRLEDRLQHQLERGLDHPVPDGRDPQPALLAAGLWDQPLPHRQRHKSPGLQVGSELGEERLLAPHGRDVVGRLAIYPGRAGALVALDPAPPNQQERRITDEVVEVAEPTCLLVGCPSVQLGLDPQYPRLGLFSRRPRCVGIHQRPPGMPAPLLRTRCRPSPCPPLLGVWPAFPASDYYGGSVPSHDQQPTAGLPATGLDGRRGGRSRTVPTFTINRSTGSVPSYSPAASPRVRRSPSPWPPGRQPQPASESPSHAAGRACAAARPRSARFRAGFSLAGVPPLVPAIRTPSRLACRARAVWQCRPVPSLSGLLPPSPAPPGLGCPQLHRAAATTQRWAFHPPGQMAPRGARGCRETSHRQGRRSAGFAFTAAALVLIEPG